MGKHMKAECALVFALLALAGSASADPADFDQVVDGSRPGSPEDRALQGFTWVGGHASGVHAVGTIGRAYSASDSPGNILWGVVSEAINLPAAGGNLVGIESGVVNMSARNEGELRGLDVVFKDRLDANLDDAVPAVGQNRFNERSSAIYVSSQPRSPAGEYAGWQAGIRFDRHSLDRSASIPWAAAIDLSQAEVPATFYLIVWRCGNVKCGLMPTEDGAAIVRDIERAR